MKPYRLIDISRELLSSVPYDGDEQAILRPLSRISEGGDYNLSAITANLHNGTHADAPYHFIETGRSIDEVSLDHFIGPAQVVKIEGDFGKKEAEQLTVKAPILLAAGRHYFLADCAEILRKKGVITIGTAGSSVAEYAGETEVHRAFLERDMVILENLWLDSVEEGLYFLTAAPIKIKGAEGSFVRAVLIQQLKGV